MCSGGGGSMPKPVTREEMEAATDNRFENPNSGVSAPSWKPDEVKKEKAKIAAEEAAREKLKITDTAEVTPRSSGGMGIVARTQRSARLRSRNKAKAKRGNK